MVKEYTVSLFVEVHDEKALYEACLATADEHTSKEELDMILLDDEGEISVEDCLRWLTDPGQSFPGCEILDSACE